MYQMPASRLMSNCGRRCADFLKPFLAWGLRSDASSFQQLKPEMASNLKLASKFNIFEVCLLQPMPALCKYLSQTIHGNLLLVNLVGMLGCGSFEVTLLYCCLPGAVATFRSSVTLLTWILLRWLAAGRVLKKHDFMFFLGFAGVTSCRRFLR